MIKAEIFEPHDYNHETPAMRLCNFINNKKIKNYTLIEEDASYWCAKQQQNKLGKRLVLIYEEVENEEIYRT